MTGILVIAHAILWTGLIVLLVIVYALTRHIGVLFERIALGVGFNARGHPARNRRAASGGTPQCTRISESNEEGESHG